MIDPIGGARSRRYPRSIAGAREHDFVSPGGTHQSPTTKPCEPSLLHDTTVDAFDGRLVHRLYGGRQPRMRERETRTHDRRHAGPAHPTTHQGILDFVNEVAALTQPDRIHWCTGSDEEWTELTDALVATGTFTRLNPAIKPNSFYAATDPIDVARVEDRTYICSVDEKDAGPTNNWMDPDEMKALMRGLYAGCMRGRTMYVIPFVMGHLDAEKPMFGIEITDSAYVTASMRVMARMGSHVLRADGGARRRLRAGPALRRPPARADGQADVAVAVQRHQVHRAVPRGADDLVLRLRVRRQRAARQEVLRAAHRQRDGPRRGLARRAHADPQAHLAPRAS